jgi:glycosyltransferase involved in cell wall biosynthesis
VNAFYFNYRTSRIKNLVDKWVSFCFFRSLHLVIGGGEAVRKELSDIGCPAHVAVAYPALREEFALAGHRERLSTKLPLQLLFVGRVHPVKGIEYLLEALEMIDDGKAILNFVSFDQQGGKYAETMTPRIRKLIDRGKIRMVGQVDDVGLLIEIYRKCDVFVIPSVWETSPTVVMEAMSVGLPVIGTKVGGIPEWVEDGVNGILVPPKDSRALFSAVTRFLEEPDLVEAMGRKGYEKSLKFKSRTWSDVGEENYRLMLSLLNSNRRRDASRI